MENDMFSRERLQWLVGSLCTIQDSIMREKGMPNYLQRPASQNVEPLKAPMFYAWTQLCYGTRSELSEHGCDAYWLASFITEPGEYLSECIQLLRNRGIPLEDYAGGRSLRQELLQYYSTMIEAYDP